MAVVAPNQIGVPKLDAPLIGPSGQPSIPWYRFFIGLWQGVFPTPVVFAALPVNPKEGTRIPVTDSNTAVWGAVIAGGGANRVLAYWNSVAWTVVAI